MLSDTATPVSIYLNLRDHYASVSLFESSDYYNRENSKSYVCVNPLVTVRVINNNLEIIEEDRLVKSDTFLKADEWEFAMNQYYFESSSFREHNGFFGYCSYDSVSHFETIESTEKLKYEDLPELHFSIFEYVIVIDNFTGKAGIIQNSFTPSSPDFSPVSNSLKQNFGNTNSFALKGEESVGQSDQAFLKSVLKAKEHVHKGDVFQVVISRCFQQHFEGDEFQVYRQLRALNPSPYMFYFDLFKARIFGASPEAQIRISNGVAEIHPIAGTIKRQKDENKNQAQIEWLKNDLKENAEHVMLVDLARNDLNKVCQDVKLDTFKSVQSFSHVIHMVSKVTGEVMKDSAIKTFTGSFPAGTLSGAPKYRAMEIIRENEPHNRGFYGGAIGHISPDGDINMAIIIRSCLSYNGSLHYQAGAGIVMDSIPENELAEVNHKIQAVRSAIKSANNE